MGKSLSRSCRPEARSLGPDQRNRGLEHPRCLEFSSVLPPGLALLLPVLVFCNSVFSLILSTLQTTGKHNFLKECSVRIRPHSQGSFLTFITCILFTHLPPPSTALTALHPPLHPGTPSATTSCPVCCPDPPTRGAVPWRSGLYWTQDKGRREEWQMVCPLAPGNGPWGLGDGR